MSEPVRVAMWSGPRNISTAMMRAFENRPDTVVSDEPLYAAYLARTGIDHPGRDVVLESQPTDIATAIAGLFAPLRPGRRIRKSHHFSSIFLIRMAKCSHRLWPNGRPTLP